jgi:ribosomal protein S18 acetylase RimI-like enzyme
VTEIAIRAATPSDTPQLEELYLALDTFHVEALPELFRAAEDPIAARDVPGLMAESHAVLLVAESGDRLAGFIRARIVEVGQADPIYLPRRYAYIDDMAVGPDFRGRGIGRALLDAIVDWAREHGIDAMELTVFEFNAGARKLYERAGYATMYRRMRKEL